MGPAHAPAHRVHAAVYFGYHPAGDNALLLQAADIADVHHGDEGAFVVLVPQQAPDVRHQNQLHGPQGGGDAGGGHVGVDVEHLPVVPRRHGGHNGHIAVGRGVLEYLRVDLPDLPHKAQLGVQLVGFQQGAVQAAQAHGFAAGVLQALDQVLVHLARQHLLDDVHGLLVGDAHAV